MKIVSIFVIASISRNMSRLREQWAALPKNPDGSVERNEHDYQTRVGICSEPVSLRELNVFTVTHKVTFNSGLQCNDDDDNCLHSYIIYLINLINQ